jgi:hypothetical protein
MADADAHIYMEVLVVHVMFPEQKGWMWFAFFRIDSMDG